jgi:hypothetical protein
MGQAIVIKYFFLLFSLRFISMISTLSYSGSDQGKYIILEEMYRQRPLFCLTLTFLTIKSSF